MADESLNNLLLHSLKDIYFAENTILKALPKMAAAARSPQLIEAFNSHLAQTKGHVQRLEQVFSMLGAPAAGVECPAILGLVKEGDELIEEFGDTEVIDLALAGAARAVEHYEIARYTTIIGLVEALHLVDPLPLLNATLEEEKSTDAILMGLAPHLEPSDEDDEERSPDSEAA